MGASQRQFGEHRREVVSLPLGDGHVSKERFFRTPVDDAVYRSESGEGSVPSSELAAIARR